MVFYILDTKSPPDKNPIFAPCYVYYNGSSALVVRNIGNKKSLIGSDQLALSVPYYIYLSYICFGVKPVPNFSFIKPEA
jgi:hypothetical protein